MASRARMLREYLARKSLLVAPGVYDGLTARLVEQAGFEVAYMTGAGTAAARGFPDYGLVTASEMADTVEIIARTITLPLIADADAGYGNELNVTRTIRDFEKRGAAAVHIEDQVAPKRCGHLDGKEIISADEFVSKIRAAVAARSDPDFVIIARTDARAVAGLAEAIARAKSAIAAGADMAFVEAVQDAAEMAAVPAEVNAPCLLNVVPGGKTPAVRFEDAQAMGYRLAILPGAALQVVVPSLDAAFRELKEVGLPLPTGAHDVEIREAFRRLGSTEWDALRRKHDGAAA